MLPTAAQDLLDLDIADAEALAAAGDTAGGYQVLTAGHRRAETARDAGQPWAEELVGRYQAAMEVYRARYRFEAGA